MAVYLDTSCGGFSGLNDPQRARDSSGGDARALQSSTRDSYSVIGQAEGTPHRQHRDRALKCPGCRQARRRGGKSTSTIPYKFGGGYAQLNDRGYDCSGSVSYVLREAGIMADQMSSKGFLNYGKSGKGDWITIWAQNSQVYMTIGGLHLDTSGSPKSGGPRLENPAA